jgi:hypothetical protein
VLGILLSEDAINAAILSKWESAGLDADVDDLEVPTPSGEVVVDDEPEPASDTDVVDEPLDTADAGDEPAPVVEDEHDAVVEEVVEPVIEKTPEEQAKQDIEDDLAAELGLGKPPDDPKKKAQWWKSRVPYSQVNKIVKAREKKLADKIAGYDTRFADVAKVEKFIQESPAEYAKTLANMFPDSYGKLFAPILGQHDGKAAPVVPAVEDLGEMPGPNLTLSDGSMTYDLEGLRARDEWVVKKTKQDVLQAFKPQMDFLDKQKTDAEKAAETTRTQQQQEAHDKAVLKAKDDAIADLMTWDYVTEADLEPILTAASKLPANLNMHQALNTAYRQVVLPRVKADKDKMRAEILKEQKAASAKKTAITIAAGQTARTVEKPDAKSEDERILAKWKKEGLI